MADYAEQECLALREVFVERTDAHRSALTAMIDALDRHEAEGVLVPALDHFSAVPSARQSIRRHIEPETTPGCWSCTPAATDGHGRGSYTRPDPRAVAGQHR